jgi:probable rRNA maturation factor
LNIPLPKIDVSVMARGWPRVPELRRIAASAVAAALDAAGTAVSSGSELSFLFADDETVRSLNRDFRHIDRPTNVLAFPGGPPVPGVPSLLGDVVMALETVRKEADLEGKPFEHHVSLLMIHGFLHLLGYDHQNDDDAEKMEAVERRALASLGIDEPRR